MNVNEIDRIFRERIVVLETAVRKIIECEGAHSYDSLEQASTTINAMVDIAQSVLVGGCLPSKP